MCPDDGAAGVHQVFWQHPGESTVGAIQNTELLNQAASNTAKAGLLTDLLDVVLVQSTVKATLETALPSVLGKEAVVSVGDFVPRHVEIDAMVPDKEHFLLCVFLPWRTFGCPRMRRFSVGGFFAGGLPLEVFLLEVFFPAEVPTVSFLEILFFEVFFSEGLLL